MINTMCVCSVCLTSRFRSSVFPFYTIGRFQNTLCTGSNQLAGTCVLGGECADGGGIATGTCSTLTRQAVCCVCRFNPKTRYPLVY